jgi:hypothetical protein
MKFLKTLKIELAYDIVIPLLSLYIKKRKLVCGRDFFTPMSIAALFTTAKKWKQSKYPSTNE